MRSINAPAAMLRRARALLLLLPAAGALAPAGLAQGRGAIPAGYVVVLDAAHGGDDTGGRLATGVLEKDAALSLSVRLRSLLRARGMEVVTTREADLALDPNRRAEVANHASALACLSLHISESGSGIHLFTSSIPPASAPRSTAWKTAQSAWITRSLALAGALNASLLHAGVNVTLSRTSLPGVDSMTCPALALELAPARSQDGKVTAEPDNPDYQARIAATLADALMEWRTEARQP